MAAEVRRLLAEERRNKRMIARMLGVSRGTVIDIALGRRPDYPERPEDCEPGCESVGLPERCPGCGGKVYLPCRTWSPWRIAPHFATATAGHG